MPPFQIQFEAPNALSTKKTTKMKSRREFLQSLGLSALAAGTAGKISAAPKARGANGMRRPNVILIMSDEHQNNTCGCYGSTVRQVDGRSPTPSIDALASEGVRFDSMYCGSPLCAPSRAAYMTGAYPHTTTALHHKMQRREAGLTRFPGVRDDLPGMGHYFREAGYRTAAIGKMHVHGELVDGWDLGFDERGLRFYSKFPGNHYSDLKDGDVNKRYREMPPYLNMKYREIDPVRFADAPPGLKVKQNGVNQHYLETLVEEEEDLIDLLVTERSIDFIERQSEAGTPFFVHVGLEKPHRPWTIHQTYLDRFNPADMPLPDTTAEWLEKGMFPFAQSWCHSNIKGDAAKRSTAAYYACASEIDDCVEQIVAKCRDLGILDNTIIIYTSDHGDSLYEHGLIEKHNMLDPAARVPFIIRAPWLLPQGAVANAPASLIDMLPTLCEMTGSPASKSFEGESLLGAAVGKFDPQRLVFSEFYQEGSVTRPDEFMPVRMGLNAAHKYIYTHAAADQLYRRDLENQEVVNNLAFDSENEALVSRMRLCTLDGWELDEYPQLNAEVQVADGVQLKWEAAAPGATYDIYRSRGTDPRQAERIAQGVRTLSFTDETPIEAGLCHYWVLGHYAVTQPFTDPRGKRRYGSTPITAQSYPLSLPITPRMRVELKEGWQSSFAYEPLLPCHFGGLSWIHIGMPPKTSSEAAEIDGPVTLLSPRAQGESYRFSAELQTQRPGYKPDQTLKLLVNYRNMHRYYLIGLDKDGTLGIWKRTGEWTQEKLASQKIPGASPAAWHTLFVKVSGGRIQVALDGEPTLDYTDPSPLPAARFGFESPHHVTAARIRDINFKK